MIYLESPETDPHFNLALEQHVFDHFDRSQSYFMLWQNDNAVIVGKHQNTVQEINVDFVRDNGISVVRRLSGGGAVYHDLGNLNFTFIADGGSAVRFDFAAFCAPVVETLRKLGVPAERNGRNDMTIEGRKFSGNAMYLKQGRVMHHGTLLYCSDLEKVGNALRVSSDKIASKGLASVRSRVTNIIDYLPERPPLAAFKRLLLETMFARQELTAYALTPGDIAAVRALQAKVYDTRAWNYGASPAYALTRSRRVEGVGKIEVHMDVEKGRIAAIGFSGDYFGAEDNAPLREALRGSPPRREDILCALRDFPLGEYIARLSPEQLADIISAE